MVTSAPADGPWAPRAGARRLVRRWALPVLYAAAIFSVSALSEPPAPPANLTDKHAHALVYGGFTVTLARALSGATWPGVTGAVATRAAVIAAGYGVTDEWHQARVPGRQADLLDLGADAAGAIAAAGVLWAFGARRANGAITPEAGKVGHSS